MVFKLVLSYANITSIDLNSIGLQAKTTMSAPFSSPGPNLLLNPFLHHAIAEIPASLQFFFFPSRQLGRPTPRAHPVIRQYALLLFCSVLIASIFALRPDGTAEDKTLNGQVALVLGFYHVGPILRSGARVLEVRTKGWGAREVEAAWYVVAHVVLGGRLLLEGRRCLKV